MRAVVTGSEGFIGARLVRELEEMGDEVIPLDIRLGIDICDWDKIKNIGKFDILYHLAAKVYVPDSYKNPGDYYRVNVIGTINALELCRLVSGRIVFASSYVYGHPLYQPIDENHPRSPFNPYARSKIIGEDLCEGYHRDFGIPVIILRPFNIYGKGQDGRFLIPSIIDQAKSGRIELKDPEPRRDWVHVDDVVKAYVRAGRYEFGGFEVFNIGSGRSLSVREVADLVVRHLGGGVRVHYSGHQRSSEVLDTIADIKKAKNILGWSPGVSIEDGIRDMMGASFS